MSSLKIPATPKRLGPIVGTGAEATLLTVAASKIAVIEYVKVVNTTTTTQTFKMSIGADAAGTRIYDDISVAPDDFFAEGDQSIPLAATETLRWNGPATLTVVVGYTELDG